MPQAGSRIRVRLPSVPSLSVELVASLFRANDCDVKPVSSSDALTFTVVDPGKFINRLRMVYRYVGEALKGNHQLFGAMTARRCGSETLEEVARQFIDRASQYLQAALTELSTYRVERRGDRVVIRWGTSVARTDHVPRTPIPILEYVEYEPGTVRVEASCPVLGALILGFALTHVAGSLANDGSVLLLVPLDVASFHSLFYNNTVAHTSPLKYVARTGCELPEQVLRLLLLMVSDHLTPRGCSGVDAVAPRLRLVKLTAKGASQFRSSELVVDPGEYSKELLLILANTGVYSSVSKVIPMWCQCSRGKLGGSVCSIADTLMRALTIIHDVVAGQEYRAYDALRLLEEARRTVAGSAKLRENEKQEIMDVVEVLEEALERLATGYS